MGQKISHEAIKCEVGEDAVIAIDKIDAARKHVSKPANAHSDKISEETLKNERDLNLQQENELKQELAITDLTLQTSKLSIQSAAKYEDNYNDIHLLNSDATISFITRSKVMVIMKGLPGSGKTVIVKRLTTIYPNSAVCSADKYFEKGNRYKFDMTKLKEAHAECQQTAVSACEKCIPLIIIDNTNIQYWEMKFYLDLATEFSYITIVVEPNTPWNKNPKILAQKNSHGVEINVLKKKVKNYDNVNPLYLGWFLNEPDSLSLLEMAEDWLKKSVEVPQFLKDFNQRSGVSSLTELLKHFSKGSYALQDARVVHCTSKYTAREDFDALDQYMESPTLKHWVGKVTSISIVSFFVTPNTLGARVALSEDQLRVWGGNDEEEEEEEEGARKKKKKRKRRFHGPPKNSQKCVNIPCYTARPGKLRRQSALREVLQDTGQLMMASGYTKGRRAHITLGTAQGIPPVQTGRELMKLIRGENVFGKGTNYPIPGAVLRDHGHGFWGIYPEKKVIVDTLFSYHL